MAVSGQHTQLSWLKQISQKKTKYMAARISQFCKFQHTPIAMYFLGQKIKLLQVVENSTRDNRVIFMY